MTADNIVVNAARAAYIAHHNSATFDAAAAWADMTSPADDWSQEALDWVESTRAALDSAQFDTLVTENEQLKRDLVTVTADAVAATSLAAAAGPADMGALLEQNVRLRRQLVDAAADADRFRPLWSSPLSREDRWTSEPIPYPRRYRYVSTHETLGDYLGAIRCSSDWPKEKRWEYLDKALHRIPDLAYEIDYLRADLANARERALTEAAAVVDAQQLNIALPNIAKFNFGVRRAARAIRALLGDAQPDDSPEDPAA